MPNRQLFRDRIAQSISRAQRKERPIAVVVLNLDGFKLVNNGHGHTAGDQVLVQVAERLIACVTAYDSVSRLGADEFAIVLSNIEHVEEVAPVLQRVCTAWRSRSTFPTVRFSSRPPPASRSSIPTAAMRIP